MVAGTFNSNHHHHRLPRVEYSLLYFPLLLGHRCSKGLMGVNLTVRLRRLRTGLQMEGENVANPLGLAPWLYYR